MGIGTREVGPGHPALIVAEIGINHDGSLLRALNMVAAAKACGADAVKVQSFSPDCFCTQRATWKGESQYALFKRYEMKREAFDAISAECARLGLIFFGTPDCQMHAEWLIGAGATAIKVGSDDLPNTPLIAKLASYGLPVILSIGMADEDEVFEAVDAAKAADTGILYCCSVYPAPLDSLDLTRLTWLRQFTDVVGFSDHTVGHAAAVAAVTLGATIIEKHFTLDKNLSGPDHQWSSDPADFAELVAAVRGIEAAISEKDMDGAELTMRVTAHRSIVAARDLPEGHLLTEADLAFKRPGDGLMPSRLKDVVGKRLRRARRFDDLVLLEHLA
jgi:N,N'-diacetyllegionaminate synthase